MNLSPTEIVLFGAVITLLSSGTGGVIAYLKTGAKRVGEDTCYSRREHIKANHEQYCPSNRQVLNRSDHDRQCELTISPIHKKLDEHSEKLDQILKELRKVA